MGFEPTTFCLGSKHSTTELYPHVSSILYYLEGFVKIYKRFKIHDL